MRATPPCFASAPSADRQQNGDTRAEQQAGSVRIARADPKAIESQLKVVDGGLDAVRVLAER
jgi:hypothetical protein